MPGSINDWFSLALWLAGIGHFCILGASFQVPTRLEWAVDLVKLKPLNRKLMWTYGGFTVLTIIAFGVLTFALHDEMLRGDRAALAMALFIGIYWACRVGVDFFYFKHDDWPIGKMFVVGHFILTALFIAIASVNIGLFIWHLAPRLLSN